MSSMCRVVVATIAAFVIGCAQHVRAQTEAPFGLAWGASTEELRALGIELKELPEKAFGVSFAASKLPRVLNDQEATLLSFGFNNRLWRIVGLSREFNNDPFGNHVKGRYQELAGILSEKYGKPKSVHSLGTSIYSEPKYFVAGIRGGQSSWFSNFNTPDVEAQLNIGASDGSTTRWRIIFENRSLKKAFENDRKLQEKNTL